MSRGSNDIPLLTRHHRGSSEGERGQYAIFLPFFFSLYFLALTSIELLLGADEAPVVAVNIRVDPSLIVKMISSDFIGFGYESSAVAQTNYFSGENQTLIHLYRNLSNHGLIRIGGCASDNTQYIPDGLPTARSFRDVSILNQKSLKDLGDFARATGWKVMWGLNLGKGTKDQAVKEAVAIDQALGTQLQSFEVGNEVEGLPEVQGHYDSFHKAYLQYKAGIRGVLPNVSFSGPDSIGHWDFITGFANSEGGDIKLLTQHYYCSYAHDPKASMALMLQRDSKFEHRLQMLEALSTEKSVPYRINEVNSFSGGGKLGVSDTFGSALWCLDYMFTLASYGCDGVNMQTDFNHLAWLSHYSPIVHDETGRCSARPEYYGMLAFALAGKGNLVRLDLTKDDINLSAYATNQDSGGVWITVINKDFIRDASVTITLPATYAKAEFIRLEAPFLLSKDQVTLGGLSVGADGKWAASNLQLANIDAGTAHLLVPRASAILLKFSPP